MSGRINEISIIKAWQVKLAFLFAIVTPTVTATGAYYGIKNTRLEDKAELIQRVNKLELESTKTFADKASLQILDVRTQKIENDVTEIKTIIKAKL